MAAIDEVFEKLEGMDGKLDKVITWQAVHKERHRALEEDVQEARKTLYHNPGGIVSRVDRLCNGKKALKSWREFFMAIGIRLVSWAAIAVIVWGLWLYKGH